ncbi:uncharacterized protein LOC100117668 isoform X1 [Nasonia vitripennis]|uniref:Uncharacterized protein n=1 Tax=Nasonia vitripennis TaxID=7425 RepID=A0A7M7QHG8_NASVI|nr:uncharacterized protein LOC100117668 isoform X1 [Nasonia vitripennis]XP_031786849.1 uncharacterized protein LOC100117668 isoform X1 [Nasonia vitripennis]XP_031786850.1 uncharacterized protein LOC100117668 isoform X1 [Nasonia vitripennis]
MARSTSLLCLLLLALVCQQPNVNANPFLTAKKVLDYAVNLYQKVDKLQKFLSTELNEDSKTETDEKSIVELEIYKKMDQLSTDFQDLRDRILDKMSNGLKDKLTEKTDELFKHVKDVQRLYKTFLDFFANAQNYESTELKDFANVATTFSLVELKATIERLHEALVDLDVRRDSIITILSRESSAADTMCIRGESSQQLIHTLYKTVVLTDAKGLLVTLYSYGLKETFENRTYEFRKNKEIADFYERTVNTFSKVRDAMADASREVWRCDTEKHEKDVTYSKLQEVFQGFFVYEPDTTRSNWHAAVFRCSALKDDRLRCKSAPCKAQPEERRCTGHLRDCQSIAHNMQLCHSPPGSDRRYDWMKTGAGTLYGRDGPCANTQGIWDIPPYLIENCLCNCESEQRDADRYFSLLDVTSDVDQNKVVTGVRLRKHNHVFHIQIQQGTLEANGTISGTLEWKEIKEISSSDLLSDKVSKHFYKVIANPHENFDKEFKYDDWTEFYKNDLVYAVTYDQNTVYLDDLDSGPNALLTGLRFQQVNDDLRLEIQSTPFDYTTGKLKTDQSSWTANTNTRPTRHEVFLTDPDDPTRTKESDNFSKNKQFVRFRMTDLRHDLGQYTVPFLDLQDAVTTPALPISGAGLFHRGRLHSGGFLGFKLIHYDFTPHLSNV